MFKLLFIGYLFGVRSERQLMREVQVNVAYRWFAGFRLTDKVPDASTFSQNRRRRYTDTTVYQGIFDEIVRQAIGHGMVDGRVLYTDSTHLKASANKNKFDVVQVEQTPSAYHWMRLSTRTVWRTARSRSSAMTTATGKLVARLTPSRSRSAAPTRTAATWCATTSPRASSTWTTARSTPSTPSLPTRMSRRPRCMTASPIWRAWTASASASASRCGPLAWMPATSRRWYVTGWRAAALTG